MSWYDEWVRETPAVTRSLTFALLGASALGFAFGGNALATIPYFVITKMEVYRVITSPLCEHNVLSLVLSGFWVNRVGANIEKELGGRAFALMMGRVAILTNVIFLLLILFLSTLGGLPFLMVYGTQGLLPTMTGIFVKRPPPVFSFFGYRIPVQYAPWVAIGFFALISNRVPMDLICGAAVGYMDRNGWLGNDLPLSTVLPVTVPSTPSTASTHTNVAATLSGRPTSTSASSSPSFSQGPTRPAGTNGPSSGSSTSVVAHEHSTDDAQKSAKRQAALEAALKRARGAESSGNDEV